MQTRIRAMCGLSLQSKYEVYLYVGPLLLFQRVGGSRGSLDLGEGRREILVLSYLTKVEKTHQVERAVAADGCYTGAF